MYEIYALKVAEREVDSPDIFYQTDYGKKTLIYYYFFCLKSNNHTILIDTGISPRECKVREMPVAATREELLSRIGIHPDDIEGIIVTHLHSDHFADPEIYSNSIFYIQRSEFEYWSEDFQRFQHILTPPFLKGNPAVDIDTLHKLNSQKRVRFVDGDIEIYPGVRTIWCGAHTPGSQLVTVQTDRGTVLFCADFIDKYRNLEEQIPGGTLTNLVEWLTNINKIEFMRLPKELVIPGHDPQLITMFTKVAENIVRIA